MRPSWKCRRFRIANLVGVAAVWFLTARLMTPNRPTHLPPVGMPLRVDRAIDGDTLLVEGGFRIRLLGVNTPETKHPNRPPEPWGIEAHQFTQTLVHNKPITLELDRERWDDYRRILAYGVLDDGSLLNERLILQGLSPAIVTFPIRGDRRRLFMNAQEVAKRQGLSLWARGE